jgi:N-acetyl-gamma-glutamyl-phosphate reductase
MSATPLFELSYKPPSEMAGVRVGVVGGSGYTGSVAARLVATHPDLALAFATSDRHKGAPLARHLLVPAEGAFAPNGAALELADTADAVLLCTSAEVSAMLAPALAERRKIVVDLSGAFRLANRADYTEWYGFEHPAPSWLGRAHYGLPELFGPAPRGPKDERPLVANPGCYATAAVLALAPLVREGLVERAGLIVDGKSGTTGAGRQATEEHSFAETAGDVRAYKPLAHQHTPEIARALEAKLTFTAHLVPMRRGLVVTAYARPRSGATAARVAECLAATYAGCAFVHAVAPAEATAKSVTGTNHAYVGATANADVVIAVCAIDNLLKGAAGQAIQNLNLACGLPEARGLEHLQRFLP